MNRGIRLQESKSGKSYFFRQLDIISNAAFTCGTEDLTELPIDVLHVALSESCFRGRLGLYTSESQRFESIDIKSHCNEQSLQVTATAKSSHRKEQPLQRRVTAMI